MCDSRLLTCLFLALTLTISALAFVACESDTGDNTGGTTAGGDASTGGDQATADTGAGDQGGAGDTATTTDTGSATDVATGENTGRVWGNVGGTAVDQTCSFSGTVANGLWVAGNRATISCAEDENGLEGFVFSLWFRDYHHVPAEFSYEKPDVWAGTTQVVGVESRILPGDTMISAGSSNVEVFSLTGTLDVASGNCTVDMHGLWGEGDNRFQTTGELNAEFDVVLPIP